MTIACAMIHLELFRLTCNGIDSKFTSRSKEDTPLFCVLRFKCLEPPTIMNNMLLRILANLTAFPKLSDHKSSLATFTIIPLLRNDHVQYRERCKFLGITGLKSLKSRTFNLFKGILRAAKRSKSSSSSSAMISTALETLPFNSCKITKLVARRSEASRRESWIHLSLHRLPQLYGTVDPRLQLDTYWQAAEQDLPAYYAISMAERSIFS